MVAEINLGICLTKKMQESMDNIDKIERYLKGQLTAEEEKSFREQLKTDKAFRDEVLAAVLMIKQMKHQNQEKEEAILEEVGKAGAGMFVDNSHGDIGQTVVNYTEVFPTASTQSASAPAASRRPWIYWVSSIAAVLIIGFFAVKPIYFNYKSDQMISQNYAQWSPREEGTTKGASRGEVQAGENVIAELTELFDNVGKGKDMKMTTYRLEKALKESETDYEYYQYTADIVWYLALAYIQENQFGKARTALAAIIESEDPYYLERAEKLYKEIENMYFM